MALYDKEGNKVEGALSPEKVEKKLKEERKKVEKTKNEVIEELRSDMSSDIDKLNSQLEQKEKELSKTKDKNVNFKKLRKSKKQATKEKEEEVEALKSKISQLEKKTNEQLNNISEKIVETTRKDALGQLVGDDKDLKKKVKEQYSNFKGQPMSKEEIRDRVKKSYILATGSTPPKEITGGHVATKAGDIPKEGDSELSPEAEDVGKKLGLSDQELDNAKEENE